MFARAIWRQREIARGVGDAAPYDPHENWQPPGAGRRRASVPQSEGRDVWPRRGQCGGRRKSVKKNAALLHFLAFSLTDHPFGVPRGEQPLGRGSLPRNSETFFVSFFGHKKGKPCGSVALIRGSGRRVAASGSAGGTDKATIPQSRLRRASSLYTREPLEARNNKTYN